MSKKMDKRRRNEMQKVISSLLIASFVFAGGCFNKKRTVQYAEIVGHLTNKLWIAKADVPTTKFFSSFDRTGGNNDYGFYLRDLEPGWGIIADCKGPGYVSRLWFTGEATNQRIRIYIDNQKEPTLECTIKEFCGQIAPFTPPLANYENYCYYNYVPIPFNKRIIIAIEKGVTKLDGPPKHYYQANIETLPASYRVESFKFPFSSEDIAFLERVKESWKSCRLGNKEKDAVHDFSEAKLVPPNNTAVVITNITGPAVIKEIKIEYENKTSGDLSYPYEPWRSVLFNIYWDEASIPSVSVPIGDFFGVIWHKVPASSLFFDNSSKILKNSFPMPFTKSAKIELINQGTEEFSFKIAIETERYFEKTNGFWYFHSSWNRSGLESVGQPHTVLDVQGEGRYAGCILSAVSFDKSFWLLEGDEIMYKDDENNPFWRGTGLEDYFNGGWYYQNIKARALHGLLNKTFFKTVQYRFHLPDAVTFKSKFSMIFERGPDHRSNGYLESTAFYYLNKINNTSLIGSDFKSRLPPSDDLIEANIMVNLLNSERASDYGSAIEFISNFIKQIPFFPYSEMLKLRQAAYIEKIRGFAEAKPIYERYLLSTNDDVKAQSHLLLWFNENPENAIVSLNANTAARLWVDGKMIMEANVPHRLFLAKMNITSGKHVMAIQFKHRPYPFWVQACIKTHKGLFGTDTDWKQALNPAGNWADIAYDDSK